MSNKVDKSIWWNEQLLIAMFKLRSRPIFAWFFLGYRNKLQILGAWCVVVHMVQLFCIDRRYRYALKALHELKQKEMGDSVLEKLEIFMLFSNSVVQTNIKWSFVS